MRYVYLVRAGSDHYKVGVASNIGKRIKALQTSNGNRVELVTAVKLPNANEVEKKLHDILRQRKLNGGREWFKLTPEQAIMLAILINRNPQVDISDIRLLVDAIEELSNKQKNIYSKMQDVLAQLHYETGISKSTIKAAENAEKDPSPKINTEKKTKALELAKQKEEEELYQNVIEQIKLEDKASTSMLQRRFSIGYGRAARIMDRLEKDGYIGPLDGASPRAVLIDHRATETAKAML